MKLWLESLVPWGNEWLVWIQTFRHPVLDFFFKTITLLGGEFGYILLIPFLYWSLDHRLGRRLGIFLFFSLSVNSFWKVWISIPRPSLNTLALLSKEPTFSFPSGHAQGMLSFWGWIWYEKRGFRLLLVCLSIVFLVSFSRLYLAVHYPQDILGGWLLAFACFCVFFFCKSMFMDHFFRQTFVIQLFLAAVPPLFLFYLNPHPHHIPTCASWLGFQVGVLCEQHWVRFSSDGTWKLRLLRLLWAIPLAGLLLGLKWILPLHPFFRFFRYSLVVFVAAFGIPWLFLQMKWAQKEAPSET